VSFSGGDQRPPAEYAAAAVAVAASPAYTSLHQFELIYIILNHLESVGRRGPCGARLGSEWGPRGVLAGPPRGPCGVRAGSVAGMPLPF